MNSLDRKHTIEEIRDVWLKNRGEDGSNWEEGLAAVYDLAVDAESARIRLELLKRSADIIYGPSDSALRDVLDEICPVPVRRQVKGAVGNPWTWDESIVTGERKRKQ